ncbi:ABC transporter substrate-binding protein [Actinosynnema sp. NPDC023587]|uniref:ABC transporter substrate-binding protein n=1 Tax=Actinosynnema sp. NPDC023587 TaxID=3154695 RepID=UPI0033E1D886
MTAIRTRLAGAAAVASFLVTAPAPAGAVDHSRGRPGICPSAAGVTVVVDFQALGGTTLVRCNSQTTQGTGLDALKGAGFQIAGVQRWGEAFICRVENRPSAVEELPLQGDEGYREACVDTPPAAGYWSYWHAGNNCAWAYSQWGVKNRKFVPGGFEGWSFSLNATAETNPVPRVAAVRPGTEGQSCVARDEGKPRSDDPEERQAEIRPEPAQPPETAQEPGQPTGEATRGTAALPPPRPRASAGVVQPTAADPGDNVAFDGGQSAPDVNDVVKEQAGASDSAPWVAGAAVVLLGAATWFTARRRKRVRES